MKSLILAILMMALVWTTAEAKCYCMWVTHDDGTRTQVQVCESSIDLPVVCGP